MEENSQKKQFSPNIIYKKIEDCFIFYEKEGSKIGQINYILDKINNILTYSKFEIYEKYDNTSHLREILEYIIRSATVLPVEQLNFAQYPLEEKDFMKVFKFFKDLYEKYIDLQQLKINTDMLVKEIEIIFKIPKATHYVQQAYLRNFSSNESIWKSGGRVDNARIFCFEKQKSALVNIGNTESEKKYGQKIINVAKSDFFYSLNFEEFMRHTLEKNISPILQKIIDSRSIKDLKIEEKIILIQYLILAWMRTFESREYLQESLIKSVKTLATFLDDEITTDDVQVDVDDIWLRLRHESLIRKLLDPNESDLISSLLTYEWGLIKLRRPKFLLTSDNPVVLNNSHYERKMNKLGKSYRDHKDRVEKEYIKSTGGSGYIKSTFSTKGRALKVEGVEIYLPISPELCLYLINQQNGIKPLKIEKINTEIIIQSNQYIFSKYNKLNFVKKILKKHPECIDKTDKRTKIKGVKF